MIDHRIFDKYAKEVFTSDQFVNGVYSMIKNACIDEYSHDQISLMKLNAFVDLYNYYPLLKKNGEKNSNRELYKIMSQYKQGK